MCSSIQFAHLGNYVFQFEVSSTDLFVIFHLVVNRTVTVSLTKLDQSLRRITKLGPAGKFSILHFSKHPSCFAVRLRIGLYFFASCLILIDVLIS